jgi:hypothetical protein
MKIFDFQRECLPPSWQTLLEDVDSSVLADPYKSKHILELIDEYVPKNKNVMECSRCFQEFEYVDVPFSIFCPYCGNANYATKHTDPRQPTPEKKEKRSLAQTTPNKPTSTKKPPPMPTSASQSQLYSFSTPPEIKSAEPSKLYTTSFDNPSQEHQNAPASQLYVPYGSPSSSLYQVQQASDLYSYSTPAPDSNSSLYSCEPSSLYTFSPESILSAGLRQELEIQPSTAPEPKKNPPVPPPRPRKNIAFSPTPVGTPVVRFGLFCFVFSSFNDFCVSGQT